MNLVATDTEASYKSMWSSPFGIIVGVTDTFSETKTIQVITFLLIITVYLIIMLNLIISLLGDAFDEFQLDAEIYNFSEMAGVILEIERILSIKKRYNDYKYLHVCMDAFDKSGTKWKGKAIDLRELIRVKFLNEDIRPLMEENKKMIEDKVSAVENKVNNLQSFLENKPIGISEEENDLSKLDKRIENIEDKINNLQKTMDTILKILSK